MNKFFVFILFALTVNTACFGQSALRTKDFNTEKNVAIQGYDAVAYFTQNKALKGTKAFSVNAEGIVYYFANAEDKAIFFKDFKKYEPQYGGWCAYAMGANGEKVEIDPESFKVLNGKLFLFYHSWSNNTLGKWNKDEANLHAKADVNWTKIYK